MSSLTDTISSFPTFVYTTVSTTLSSLYSKASDTRKIYLPIEDLNDKFLFLIEFVKDPLANGSIFPSSPQLTEKMIKFIPEKSQISAVARRYLEVGAGTGPFTEGIVERLDPYDTLDIVELNPSFCETLTNKFSAYPNVHIHCLSITDWNPEEPYDAVISGLPLNGFSPELVDACLDVFKKITKTNGTISYFEYPRISKICLQLYYGEKKAALEKVLEIKEQFFKTYGFESEIVEENFPTAKVLHFRMRESDNEPSNQTPTISNLSDAS